MLALLIASDAEATTFCGVTIPAEIAAQAVALKNDPDLIYEFVYDNIRTLPLHGSLKGPLGTLLDRSGTETDQAELMASLLQAAGYSSAEYQTGDITIDAAQLTGWLGVDNSTYSARVLANGGFNTTATVDGSGYLLYATVPWVWVKVQIGGVYYVFDPAGKRIGGYNRTTGLANLDSVLGYVQSSFLANAELGSTSTASIVTGWSIAGLNRNGVRANLQSNSQNLVNYIKANAPSASTSDIIGGTEIARLTVGTHQRILAGTGFSYAASTPVDDSCLPTGSSGLRTVVSFTLPGASTVTFNTSDLYDHRLTLFFDSSIHPVIRLDGVVQAIGSAATSGSSVTLTTLLTHNAYCYPSSCTHFADIVTGDPRSTSLKVTAGANATYVINSGWGAVGRGMVERHRLLLQQNATQHPGDPGAEPVLGESLAMMGYTWLAELARSDEVADDLAGTVLIYQYGIGIVGIRPVGSGSGPYIDLPINTVTISQRIAQPVSSGITPLTSAVFYTHGLMMSALESGVIEQTQPTAVAVSTVKLVDLASASPTEKIFDLNNSDIPNDTASNYTFWTRAIFNSTWSSGDMSRMDAAIYSQNQRVIAPAIGNVAINGLWTGVGFFALSQAGDQFSALITGGLSGGFSASLISDPLYVLNITTTFRPSSLDPVSNQPGVFQQLTAAVRGYLADPVNRVTGSFTYTNSDLSIGSAGFPWGLQFQRYYDSAAYLRNGPLGLGWTNGFAITAKQDSDGFEGMAANSPINGASAIAALYVMQDILNNQVDTKKPLVNVVIASQAAAWLMEQLTNNVVAINQPENVSVFVKLVDSTFNPPFGSADRLTLASGAYTLSQKDGSVVTFNSASAPAPGAIATWHSPAGPTVTYNYNGGGYLTSVTTGSGAAGTNRTLSLAYNGSNQLTAVSDGTGRSVFYAYDASGNLTQFTDTLGNATTYAYDPANQGRMLQYFHPSAPTTPFITNIYDAVGRVTLQTDAAGNATGQYYAGTRTETDDALGDAHVLYFTERGQALIDIDALGNQTVNTYDGLDRLVTTTLPEGDGVAYSYDANSNPVTITANAKPGSGLSPLISTVTYDPLRNTPAAVTDPLGLVTQFVYDHTTGNLLRTIADAGGGSGHTSVVTGIFTYNARGQVLTAADAGGVVTSTVYDSFGNATAITLDSGGLNQTTAMAYDTVGNVTSVTDPNSNTSTSAYDARRRVTSTTAPPTPSAAAPLVTAFTYDADDRLLQTQQSVSGTVLRATSSTYTAIGQVATSTDADANVTRFAYDAAGRMVDVTDPLYNVTGYGYDADGRRIAVSNLAIQSGPLSQISYSPNGLANVLTDANGNAVTLGYDGLDRLSSTTYPGGAAQSLTYDGDGNALTRVTRNGDTIAYAYNTLNQLCSKAIATTPTACTASNSTNHTVWYAYDVCGRNTAVRDNGATLAAVGAQASYATSADYDPLNRPVNVSWNPASAQATPSASSVTFGHDYDADNRRVAQAATDTGWWAVPSSSAATSYTANSLNQYTAVNAVTPTYDANGNLTSDGSFTYCYDAESRLTSILSAGTCASPTTFVATYAYDATGRRKSRTVSGVTTVYVADADGREVLEYDGTSGAGGAVKTWYAYGPGSNAVVNRMDVAAGTRTTLVPDIQGSIVASLDSGSGVVTRWGYRPYGENTSLTTDSFAYTAQRHDPETSSGSAEPSGLYYDRARMYSPTLGRFLTPDPSDASATNLYAYVGNDPLNQTDPSGMFAERGENAWDVGTTANTWGNLDFYKGMGENALQQSIDSLSLVTGGAANSLAGLAGYDFGDVFGAPANRYESAGRFTAGALSFAAGGFAAAAERAGLFAADEILVGSFRNVNPTGGLDNCLNCAFALDATLAGRPTSALPGDVTPLGDLEQKFGKFFLPVSGQEEITAIMSRFGNNSRGMVYGASLTRSPGHVFNVINKGGVIQFLDGQSGGSGLGHFTTLRNFHLLVTSVGGR